MAEENQQQEQVNEPTQPINKEKFDQALKKLGLI